jgi:hypothetical protein
MITECFETRVETMAFKENSNSAGCLGIFSYKDLLGLFWQEQNLEYTEIKFLKLSEECFLSLKFWLHNDIKVVHIQEKLYFAFWILWPFLDNNTQ